MFKIISRNCGILKHFKNKDISYATVSPMIHLFRTTSQISKDVIAIESNSQQSSGPDILLKNMKSATETSDVLLTVRMHHSIMNNRHLMQAFKSIFTLQKAEESNLSNGEIIKSPEFKILCQALKSQIRVLELDDRVDALKTLSFLGVPSASKIVQILLLAITKDINDLSLQQITFFDFLIKDFDSFPLVDALRIALPIVFEANLKTKTDPDSLPHLTELLHYTTRKNLSSASLFLIELLMRKRSEMDFKSARSIIRSICDLKICDIRHRPLLHHSLDVMVENELKCTYQDYDLLMSKLVARFSQKNNFFYHEEFVNSATKYIIDKDAGFNEGVWLLRKATKFGHVCYELLDYLMEKVDNDARLIENCGTAALFAIVNGLAQADYRPPNWDKIEPLIVKNAISHSNVVELPWLKFTRDLCTLDCWPLEIFERVFSKHFLEKFLSREYNTLDYLQVLSLYQAVKSLCPWYTGPFPPDHIIEKGISLNGTNVTDFPLTGALVQGLGDERYVLNGVYTKLGHFIDHLVILRKGGYPMAFTNFIQTNTRIYVEDLPKNNECQLVAVLFLPPSAFTINTNKLKGSIRLSLNSLDANGISVVSINSTSWEQLLDSEKIPYLMASIKTNE